MKKICILLLAMLFVVSGCGKKAVDENKEPKKTQNSEVSETAKKGEFEKVDPKVDAPIVSEETVLGDFTSEFLSKYVEGGSYYIVQNSVIDGVTTKVEIAVKGDKVSEKIGNEVKIIDGDTLYYVIHDIKTIFTSPVVMSMKEGFTDFISVKTSAQAQSSLQNTGEEELLGEKFGFEEFKNTDGTVAKYYYDDKTLRYVKVNKAGVEEIIQVVEISTKIPDQMFKVPDGYVIQDLSKMGQ